MTEPTDIRFETEIAKLDQDQRLVYGWATIYRQNGQPVIDRQGDQISEAEVVKMAHRFVDEARIAKAMHQGQTVGSVVESLVLTEAIQKALGIDLGKAGWFIGMHIDDDAAWQKVKTGEWRTLSIGGQGRRVPMEEPA